MERRLHIGGVESKEGWEIFNICEGDFVDHKGDALDLSRFEDNTFEEIYASHIIEHLDYIKEIETALREWFRVLKSGGKLYVSAPDLDTLAQLIVMKDKFTVDEQFHLMRMIFGGHTNKYDYHKTGLTFSFLSHFLTTAGFSKIERVKKFDMFNDASSIGVKGVLISLNVVAEK